MTRPGIDDGWRLIRWHEKRRRRQFRLFFTVTGSLVTGALLGSYVASFVIGG